MKQKQSLTWVILVIFPIVLRIVKAHGMVLDPPSRSSMWRFGFNVPINYDDDGLYCGGFGEMYNDVNQGRCGECGDEWRLPRPRPNEEGGLYGTGLIGQNYVQGAVIQITVNMTTSHLGHFEFRLCAKRTSTELVTQFCLDRNVLQLLSADGKSTGTRYLIGERVGLYVIKAKLPDRVFCKFCVLQWHYRTGNSWGQCDDNISGDGCGQQEIFRNCADISIKPRRY